MESRKRNSALGSQEVYRKFAPAVKNKGRKRGGGKDNERMELRCEFRDRGEGVSEHRPSNPACPSLDTTWRHFLSPALGLTTQLWKGLK